MSDKTKNIIERAIKTFFEAFISTLIVGFSTFDYAEISDKKKVLTVILLPAIAAALSAVWNYIQSKRPPDEPTLYDEDF